jgi:hypothetical protein
VGNYLRRVVCIDVLLVVEDKEEIIAMNDHEKSILHCNGALNDNDIAILSGSRAVIKETGFPEVIALVEVG